LGGFSTLFLSPRGGNDWHENGYDRARQSRLSLAGFIATFTRGTEWAASGRVTIPVPDELK
jgi:hypothetical protein